MCIYTIYYVQEMVIVASYQGERNKIILIFFFFIDMGPREDPG
jgi:hypothetical protein